MLQYFDINLLYDKLLKRQNVFLFNTPPPQKKEKHTLSKQKSEKLDLNSTPTSTAEQFKYWLTDFFQWKPLYCVHSFFSHNPYYLGVVIKVAIAKARKKIGEIPEEEARRKKRGKRVVPVISNHYEIVGGEKRRIVEIKEIERWDRSEHQDFEMLQKSREDRSDFLFEMHLRH